MSAEERLTETISKVQASGERMSEHLASIDEIVNRLGNAAAAMNMNINQLMDRLRWLAKSDIEQFLRTVDMLYNSYELPEAPINNAVFREKFVTQLADSHFTLVMIDRAIELLTLVQQRLDGPRQQREAIPAAKADSIQQ